MAPAFVDGREQDIGPAAVAPVFVSFGQAGKERQAQAVAAIEQDPFVRELVDTFDGRIVGSSIKPKE